MARWTLLLLLACAPLAAADPGANSPLVLSALRVEITAAADSADYTVRATVTNPGEDAVFTFTHPGDNLAADGVVLEAWEITIAQGTSIELTWTATSPAALLPHLHPVGLRRLRVPLAHMRGYAELPAAIEISLTHPDLPAELFTGRTPGRIAIIGRVPDAEVEWLATTAAARMAELTELLAGFDDHQRTHDSRAYTATLVHLADLHALTGDHAALAEISETLAALETAAGRTITHCGPWAKWRKHVPWTLQRLAALEAQGKDAVTAAAAAKAARAAVQPVWEAWLKSRGRPRPFDAFDAVKFGGFWDYDWDTTRALYARALEILGDAAGAAAVRESE